MDTRQTISPRTNWVPREEALAYCRLARKESSRILLVQARAGQGKTTLAEQYAQEFEGNVCWCACSGADADHMELLNKLCSALTQATDSFTPSGMLAAARSSLSPEEARAVVAKELPGVFSKENTPILVIVDDAHLLGSAPESMALLRTFVNACPDRVVFAILTRTSLQLDNKALFAVFDTVRIDEETLALSGAEIAQLHEKVHGKRLSSSECAAILLATEGWTTGALLMGLGSTTKFIEDTSETLSLYFWDTCLAGASRQSIVDIMKMALLDEFPVSMVRTLGMNEGALLAEELAARNLFVRVGHAAVGPVYRIHHLFRDSLRHMARNEMSKEQHTHFLSAAAEWHLEHGDPAEGLRCFVTAQLWDELALGLQTHGMMLVNTNRLKTLESIITDCPESVIRSHGWLMLLLGRVRITVAPEHALDMIAAAHRRFVARGDQKGELIALIFHTFAHLFVTGQLRQFIRTIPRARELFQKFCHELSAPTQVVCTVVLALAHSYGLSDQKRMQLYTSKARETLSSMGVEKPTPDIELVSLQYGGVSGYLKPSVDRLDRLFTNLHAPEVTPSTRLTVSTSYANFRLMQGDVQAYSRCKKEVERDFSEMMQQSFLGAFFTVWDADVHLARGNIDKAAETAQSLLEHPSHSRFGHIKSQAHQYLALCNAFTGNHREALEQARLSSRTRAEIGGWFFIRLNHAVVGATLALCGEHQKAERVLQRALKDCAVIGECYITPQILAYRAWSRLEQGRRAEAHEDIRRMLEQLHRQGNRHFFYREAGIMRCLIDEAQEHAIMPDAARPLADAWFETQAQDTISVCLREARAGLQSLKHQAPWSAHLHFSAASDCIGRLSEHEESHRTTFLQAYVAWIELLQEAHRPDLVATVAEKAFSLFPESPELLAISRSLRTSGLR